MRVALFVPCYVDQLFPDVGLATLELLETSGCDVWVPDQVACCGQPMINSGAVAQARNLALGVEKLLSECDCLVCPSGSCAATLRQHASRYGLDAKLFSGRIFELSEFLATRIDIAQQAPPFVHRVALHQSCHGLRELGLGQMSELVTRPGCERSSPAATLLSNVRGLTLVAPERVDECCGFGGSFSVREPSVSVQMGNDRLSDFEQAGAQVIASVDMSCLMHLSGLIRRQHRTLEVMHLAQILAGRPLPASG